MLNPYSCIGKSPDYTMAEFTVFPAYRRKHLAFDVVNAILNKHPGQWEIKYNENNLAAKHLWSKVSAAYSPEVFRLNGEETVLLFKKNLIEGSLSHEAAYLFDRQIGEVVL